MFRLRRPRIKLPSSMGWSALTIFAILLVASAWLTGLVQSGRQVAQPAANIEPDVVPEPEPEPVITYSALGGIETAPELAERSIVATVISNSKEARPQTGLTDADMIYEVPIEGGTTRYVALFQAKSPEVIGPIRSLRSQLGDIALAYDASLAHVGGSQEALGQVSSRGIRSLNEFSNQFSFWRSPDRFAPHNVYTSNDLQRELAGKRGYTTNDYTPWNRKDDQPAEIPNATSINLRPGLNSDYHSSFIYDATSNSYLRNLAGAPHADLETSAQINPRTVVVLVTTAATASDGVLLDVRTTGLGQALVFQDGTVERGTWNRSTISSSFTLTGESGDPLALNRGQTWVTFVTNSTRATFQ